MPVGRPPPDRRGTGRRGRTEGGTMTQPEGQTARDIFSEDEGLPEVANEDSPTSELAEDPEFAPLPGERPNASTDFGTTSLEQGEGESLDVQLAREIPADAPDVRPAEDPQLAVAQLEQDLDTTPYSESSTNPKAAGIGATAATPIGGEGPEESAVHIIDG